MDEPRRVIEPGEARDIVSKMQALLNEGEPLARDFRQVAEVNDAFVAGSQFGGVTFKHNKAVITKDEWFDDENIPRVYVNILGNLVATLVSLITKNRPCAVARALNEESPEDIYDAEQTNTLIRYLSQELKTVEVIQRAVKFAEDHGTGFIKAWFDPEKKKACIAPVSIFNVTIDPQAESTQDAQWFIFHRWLRVSEAKKHIASTRAQGHDPKPTTYTTASGLQKSGVPAFEVWVRPGWDEDYPRGYYAFVVDKVVVEKTDYPLIVETDTGIESLPPLVTIVAKSVEECVYGRTSVTDCIPLQRVLNETTARTLKYLRIGSSPKFIYPAVFSEGFDAYAEQELEVPGNEAGAALAQAFRWLEGPKIPQEAFELREFCIKQMHDVLGVNALTAGTQTRSVSGKALEEIEGLDQQKNSQTTRSIETATLELYRLLIAIVQLFYPDGVKLQITGGSMAEVMLLNRADIMGKDIRLEPASEFDLMQPVQEQAQVERQQQGLATASDVHAAGRDPRTAYSKQLAEKLIAQMLAGQDIELGADDIDPDAFKAVVAKHKHLAMLDGRRADYLALVDLEKFIDGLAVDQMQAAPPQPGAQPDQQQPQPPAPATQPEGPVQ